MFQVHKVIAGSLADRDGRIQKGDRVLSINGRSTKGVSHREALSILKVWSSSTPDNGQTQTLVIFTVRGSAGLLGDFHKHRPLPSSHLHLGFLHIIIALLSWCTIVAGYGLQWRLFIMFCHLLALLVNASGATASLCFSGVKWCKWCRTCMCLCLLTTIAV